MSHESSIINVKIISQIVEQSEHRCLWYWSTENNRWHIGNTKNNGAYLHKNMAIAFIQSSPILFVLCSNKPHMDVFRKKIYI